MDKNTRFYYKHCENGGVITAAALRDEDRIVRIGLAFCSPKDHFKKEIGRKIAIGRAIKNPTMVNTGNSTSLMKSVVEGLRGVALADYSLGIKNSIPNWV